jgi:hypothetical protein
MKKYLSFFVALAIASAGMLATQGLSAQKRVVKVQGHPHELLTQKHGGKEDATARTLRTSGDAANIILDSIKCWAGGVDPTLPVDSAVLLIKWTDGHLAGESGGDSILAWGYRWNPINSGGYAVKKYTIDMIRAVANADCRFSALLQNSSAGDFVVGGFGYSLLFAERLPMEFDEAGAKADTMIKFHYDVSPNCVMGQGAIPYDVPQQVQYALIKAEGDNQEKGTGIIEHPFDADYGYPAYDFDYWNTTSPGIAYYEWQSGWYKGYWAFYVKDQLAGDFTYPTESGIATHLIKNHSVSGFVFEPNMDFPSPYSTISGDFTARECYCGCNASATKENVTGKRK